MQFLAGIVSAWAVVVTVVAIGCVAAYLMFGRNRGYLIFAAYCLDLSILFVSRAGRYLATDFEQAEIWFRFYLASLPLTAVALFYLSINNYGLGERRARALQAGSALIGMVMSALCLIGPVFDAKHGYVRTLFVLSKESEMFAFPLTVWGYVVAWSSLGFAATAAAMLAKKAREDRIARAFYNVGIAALVLIALNDMALGAELIKSVFLLEHGLFFLTLCVLVGFLREYELSRRRLLESTEALENTSQRLDRAIDDTRKLRPMADLGRLSASLAHEVRNPLAALNNVTSALQHLNVARAGAETFQSLVKILQEEIDRLARLVDDLLLYASSGRLSRQQIEAASVVQAVVLDAVRQLAPGANVEIVTEVQEGLPPFSGNLENLRRALLNLVVNAVQSSGVEGRVEVIARLSPDPPRQIMLGVRDRAGGVPEEELSNIFEPFYSTRPTGTGLGLPIAKSIVEANNGSLRLENQPGIGATFWICLPVDSPVKETDYENSDAETAARGSRERGSGFPPPA